jgi:hypothetical protein
MTIIDMILTDLNTFLFMPSMSPFAPYSVILGAKEEFAILRTRGISTVIVETTESIPIMALPINQQ